MAVFGAGISIAAHFLGIYLDVKFIDWFAKFWISPLILGGGCLVAALALFFLVKYDSEDESSSSGLGEFKMPTIFLMLTFVGFNAFKVNLPYDLKFPLEATLGNIILSLIFSGAYAVTSFGLSFFIEKMKGGLIVMIGMIALGGAQIVYLINSDILV